jgi:hypothetical protein
MVTTTERRRIAARLKAIAHGGQVLVSNVRAELTGDVLGSDVRLIDLGEHRLRDLSRPEHVYQLVASGFEQRFPPLRSIDVLPTNLPVQLTSFVGRSTEVRSVAELGQATLVDAADATRAFQRGQHERSKLVPSQARHDRAPLGGSRL